jgi:hypothetical protein
MVSARRSGWQRGDWRIRHVYSVGASRCAAPEVPVRSDPQGKDDLKLAHVRLLGLKTKPELNGKLGQALEFDRASGRWEVMLRGTVKTVWIKPANLERAPDPSKLISRASTTANDFLSDLPRARAFAASNATARGLCAEAVDGTRSHAAMRIFFEAADDALDLIEKQQRDPMPLKYWQNTPNRVDQTPQEALPFDALLAQQCECVAQLGRHARILHLPHANSGFFGAPPCPLNAPL